MSKVIIPKDPNKSIQLRSGVDFREPDQKVKQNSMNDVVGFARIDPLQYRQHRNWS